MTLQYIYIIQTREFINLNKNVYKIGKTTQSVHKRYAQYPKGSILLYTIPCTDCSTLEKNVIKDFKEKFIHRTEFGTEYFEGNLKSMIVAINTIWQSTSFTEYHESVSIPTLPIIPTATENTCTIEPPPTNTLMYIEKEEIDTLDTPLWKIINTFKSDKPIEVFHNNIYQSCVEVDNGFFYMLVKKGIIKFDEELNEKRIQKLQSLTNKYRFNINIENFTDLCNDIEFKYNKCDLCNILSDNILLNNLIYAYSDKNIKKMHVFDHIGIWIYNPKEKKYQTRSILSIEHKYYDYDCLRKIIPYCIEYNNDGRYYYINRNYKYIGTDSSILPENRTDDWKREYLFDDSCKPWESRLNLEKYHRRLAKSLSENKLTSCMTKHCNLLGYQYRESEPERSQLISLKTDAQQIKSILETQFIINPSDTNEHNFTKSRTIIDFIRSKNLNLSDTKIGRELANIGLIKFNKKIDGKTVMIWKGIFQPTRSM